MSRRTLSALLLGLLLAGCAGGIEVPFTRPVDTVKFDRGQFALAYADTAKAYVLLAAKVAAACQAGKFDPGACTDARRAKDQLDVLEARVRQAILTHEVAVDWDAIGRAISIVVGLASGLPFP